MLMRKSENRTERPTLKVYEEQGRRREKTSRHPMLSLSRTQRTLVAGAGVGKLRQLAPKAQTHRGMLKAEDRGTETSLPEKALLASSNHLKACNKLNLIKVVTMSNLSSATNSALHISGLMKEWACPLPGTNITYFLCCLHTHSIWHSIKKS